MAKAEERFDHCAFRGCLTLEEHKIGRCSRSIIAESVQNFTPSSGDYLSIVDNTGFRERLQSYIAAPRHMVACHFCNGTWDSPLIEPAIQCA